MRMIFVLILSSELKIIKQHTSQALSSQVNQLCKQDHTVPVSRGWSQFPKGIAGATIRGGGGGGGYF